MTPRYILNLADRSAFPIAVFHCPERANSWLCMPMEGQRFERVVDEIGLHRCVGIYNARCPEEWLAEDIAHAEDAWER